MSAKKAVRGKRYSDSKKAEIVDFVQRHDAENGRGGRSAAVKKYGVTALTLSTWLSKTTKEPKGKRRGGGKVGRPRNVRLSIAGNRSVLISKAEKLLALAREIEAQETGLHALRNRFVELKRSI